ncbi:MAG: hypothetical protein LC808_16380, partial [Actinobacteria bacterium]|nr:hypothetical protein [Actinomycetota bacterium]
GDQFFVARSALRPPGSALWVLHRGLPLTAPLFADPKLQGCRSEVVDPLSKYVQRFTRCDGVQEPIGVVVERRSQQTGETRNDLLAVKLGSGSLSATSIPLLQTVFGPDSSSERGETEGEDRKANRSQQTPIACNRPLRPLCLREH